ncbi:MAG: hypothetical protein HXS48_10565 [Theionarchaea archaeon]|nr:MAG: hypothetical protein AYK19_14300 [Theionarchaea archaeon DG-70-1]MBU7027368.1 hypothetical protein [Theionarchaea archaeon]
MKIKNKVEGHSQKVLSFADDGYKSIRDSVLLNDQASTILKRLKLETIQLILFFLVVFVFLERHSTREEQLNSCATPIVMIWGYFLFW